jgi:glycosyltransferase involved in cell wall biosynthesis
MLVSIIIPCYNAQAYVAEAIQSALNQTYPHCEIIVIDDGSSDGSLEIIKSFGAAIRSESGPNRGGCAARNRGFSLSRGGWIQFLDADDRLAPNKISAQMEALRRQPGCLDQIATCAWYHFTATEEFPPTRYAFLERPGSGIDLLIELWLAHGMLNPGCWLISRALAESIGPWDESLSADQDGEYFGRVMLAAHNVVFSPEATVGYRIPSAGNVSRAISDVSLGSRCRATRNIAERLLERRDDVWARSAVAHRLMNIALLLWQDRRTDAEELIERARQVRRHPLGHNKSRFLRVSEALVGTRNAIVLRTALLKIRRKFS